MIEPIRVKNIGLRGVTVADTKISFIDGEQGILIYRGYRVEELAEKSSFIETAYLLLNGMLPDAAQLDTFSRQIAGARQVPGFLFESLKRWPREAHPMDVLQASIPLLGMADPDLSIETRGSNVWKAARLIARIPILMAAWHRIRNGREPLPPDDTLSHAGNFLWQLSGVRPDEEMARDFDVCLILHADHTFNASTFACREVVSTRAHMYAGVAAGVGALSGSLHGGANAEVMKMLLELESGKDIKGWVKSRPAPMSPSKKGDKGRPVIPLILSLPHSSGFSLLQGELPCYNGSKFGGNPKASYGRQGEDKGAAPGRID